jgi:phosphodiesterase/alkaline phosphatase D-like protein
VDVGSGGSPVAVAQGVGALLPGTTYHYRLVAENASGKSLGSDQTFTTTLPPPAPAASTGVASGVTRTAATLAGTIDPNGLPTVYHFEYGESTAYGLRAPTADAEAGFGSANVEVSNLVVGLAPGTTYHYRLIAQSLGGTIYSQDRTFTTSTTPPAVATGAPSGVSQNAATVSGTVGTRGLQTIYGFETGTEAGSYGPPILAGSLGGAVSEGVSLNLGGLLPGVTYHYRIEATNVDGSTYGEDQSFTTPVFVNPFSVPVVLPFIGAPATAFPREEAVTTGPGKAKAKKVKRKHRKKKGKGRKRKKKK